MLFTRECWPVCHACWPVRMSGGADHVWNVKHTYRRETGDLQRHGRFAHAGRASEQVQPLGEAAQEVIELREAGRHTQHSTASHLPLQAAPGCGMRVRGRQPVCRYMRALSRLDSNNKWLPRILRTDE